MALMRALSDYRLIGAYFRHLPQVDSQLQRRLPNSDAAALRATAPPFLVQADLTERKDVRRLIEICLARFDKVDTVINCAADTRFHGKLSESWYAGDTAIDQLSLNCVAPMTLVSLLHDYCWKDNPSENAIQNRSIINVSSVSGLYAFENRGQGFYSASKAALNMLSLYLSLELAPYSVRANAVCPDNLRDRQYMDRVVRTVRRLVESDETGEVVTEFG